MLHPDFPSVDGQYQMTRDWATTLPEKFNRRFEDGALVLWRPGLTAWINVWGNDLAETAQHRCEEAMTRANSAAFDAKVVSSDQLVRYSYRLREGDDQGAVPALYGFVFGAQGHVQAAFYFDSEKELEVAQKILASMSETLQVN